MTEPDRTRKRILVIYNPIAGWRTRRRFKRTLDRLSDEGRCIEVRETCERGDAEGLAADAASGRKWDVVVAAGGDGTVNEVANGLSGSGLPLAILPTGTANVLALEIGLGATPRRVVRTILDGRPVPLTGGSVNGRRFLLWVGVGFDGRVVAALRPGLKRIAGKIAYVVAGLGVWLRWRAPALDVTIDGRPAGQVAWVIVANLRLYAGGFVLTPRGSPRRPGFEVILFRGRGRLALVRYMLALTVGAVHRLKDVEVVRAERVKISGPSGEPVQVDGDADACLPLEIAVAPGAVDLIEPAT